MKRRGGKMGFRRNEKGFTGLEAAIVLIAFVVVAAVFSYVMLGAGFYTTQKIKRVVDTGVQQASSSLTLDGQYIYLIASEKSGGDIGSDGKVGLMFFYVTQTAGGTPVDLEKTSVALTTENGFKQLFFDPLLDVGDKVYFKTDSSPYDEGELLWINDTDSQADLQTSDRGTIDVVTGKLALGGNINVTINGTTTCNGTIEKISSVYLWYNNTTGYSYYLPAVSIYINDTDDNTTPNNCTIIAGKGWWYESVSGDTDNVVEVNEKYKILIAASAANSTVWRAVWDTDSAPWDGIGVIQPTDVITIEVRPPIGAPLTITKTMPASFEELTYV
ncbi:MAG: archaeal flagellin FlaB [Archaeoglobaceae archaeon]|nr:archaeal flagellin FlaB [Archaeoglobaceae archaeon]